MHSQQIKENLNPLAVGAPVNVKLNSPVMAVWQGYGFGHI
jgi:hypothetical protein